MKPLLFLCLTGILCACTLSEQADMEINPKPTLVVEYRYTDTNGNNTTHEEIGHTVSLLFDPAGMFLREITAFGEPTRSPCSAAFPPGNIRSSRSPMRTAWNVRCLRPECRG